MVIEKYVLNNSVVYIINLYYIMKFTKEYKLFVKALVTYYKI